MNLAERVGYWSRWQPERIAIRTADEDVTWARLGEEVARVAGGLAARGVGVGDRVGILGANSPAWCVLALAALHRGAIVVPLNIRLAPPELREITARLGCTTVAYDTALADLHDAARADAGDDAWRTIALDDQVPADVRFGELLAAEPLASVDREDDDVAVLGCTSGTTGLPKGVMLTHGNIAALALQTICSEGSVHDRRTLLCIPLAFTGGIINNFLSNALAGGTLVLEPAFVPDRVIELLAAERITTLFAVPVMWQAIAGTAAFADADLGALTSAITGGAPVPRKLLDAYHAKGVVIRQAYGLTEATGSVAMPTPDEALAKPEAAGQPNAHTHVRILDEAGADMPAGEVGEIAVRGPQVMAGYWNDQEATEKSFRDGWLLTGDMASLGTDGLLRIADRKKSMFISGGLNVYPAEIERIVDSLPDVAESVAFGLAHERWGEACALVVRGTDGAVDEEALVAHCRTQLADYKVPRTIFQITAPLPRGMSGKILRDQVPGMLEDQPA
ncbi:Long-chain-fatty-acid--CoA ligase [Paraconexibacter sp. AEG42_29]|uniref:Long-chain-fatty-acid--CoA ligase n=1 Tax=Paraconexibacter sp. AEG42_29 TaxID=2997339 RepID=A0AAU7APL1_9ACTN